MAKNTPKLRLHKARGLAVVTLRDSQTSKRRDYYCGRWGSPESVDEYARLIRAWNMLGQRLPGVDDVDHTDSCTVGELVVEFNRWAKGYYSEAEVSAFRSVLRMLRDLYAGTPAAEFTPRRLELLRDAMIGRGWTRKSINRQVGRVRQVFGYGVRLGLVSVEVQAALKSLPALRRGKSAARETGKVKPVPQATVDATLARLSRPLAALVRVQLLTGARSGELVIMRPCDIDRTGKVWVYTPTSHKTEHHDHERHVYVGPAAQAVIGPMLTNRPPDAYVFSPLDAQGRAPVSARRTRYTPNTYAHAVKRACDAAYPPPDKLSRRSVKAEGRKHKRLETPQEWRKRIGEDGWAELQQWRRDHRWHPHQLRHSAATTIRREFGIELARIILGHKSAAITQVYAEADQAAAVKAMLKLG